MELVNSHESPTRNRESTPEQILQKECEDAEIMVRIDQMLKEVDQLIEIQVRKEVMKKKQGVHYPSDIASRRKPTSIATLYKEN